MILDRGNSYSGKIFLRFAKICFCKICSIHEILPLRTNYNPAKIYLFKVNNRGTRKRYEICSKLTINTPERRH